MLQEETPADLSRKLCEDHGCTFHSSNGQKPHLTKKNKRIDCSISNYVPFVVPGSSTSSSSPVSSSTPSPSSSQESISANRENRDIENPVSERNRSTNGKLRKNPLQESTEITVESGEVQREKSHELPNWCYRNLERIWLMKVVHQSHGETLSKKVKTLPRHLMNFQWSREQKWNRVRVSTVYIRTFRRTQIVISA